MVLSQSAREKMYKTLLDETGQFWKIPEEIKDNVTTTIEIKEGVKEIGLLRPFLNDITIHFSYWALLNENKIVFYYECGATSKKLDSLAFGVSYKFDIRTGEVII